MNKWYKMVSDETWEKLKTLKESSSIPAKGLNLKEFLIAISILNLEKHNIVPYKDTFVYRLQSKLSFGKFKGNELSCVYKVSPDYIEWCIQNAEGFIIHPKDIELMKHEKVFDLNDILKYASDEGDSIKINMKDFARNEARFPIMVNVGEKEFMFSQFSLDQNKNKLIADTDLEIIEKGADWHNKNYNLISSELRRKKHVNILSPK